jgi:TFIIF-interacting CTD phosphatase-like protein
MVIPNSSCIVQPSRKRKRPSEHHVRFCTQPQSVIYTWSQSDYDRSGFYIPETNPQQQLIFTLSINFVHKETQNKPKFNSKRPKLSIDTTNLQGPLYFTKMTTNHQKQMQAEEDKEEVDHLTRENTRRNSLVLC